MKKLLIAAVLVNMFAIFPTQSMDNKTKNYKLDWRSLGLNRSRPGEKAVPFETIFPAPIDEEYMLYCVECSKNSESPLKIKDWYENHYRDKQEQK